MSIPINFRYLIFLGTMKAFLKERGISDDVVARFEKEKVSIISKLYQTGIFSRRSWWRSEQWHLHLVPKRWCWTKSPGFEPYVFHFFKNHSVAKWQADCVRVQKYKLELGMSGDIMVLAKFFCCCHLPRCLHCTDFWCLSIISTKYLAQPFQIL